MENRLRAWWLATPGAERWASLLLVVFLFARLGLALVIYSHPERALFAYDTRYYLELTQNLLEYGTFEAPSYPEQSLVRTPGYTIFLAILFRFFGTAPGNVVLVQLLMTVGICGLIYAIGKRLRGSKAGLAAGWIYALNPNSLFWALTILSDTFFTFLLTIASYHFLLFILESRNRNLIFSGTLLGFATLVRPVGLLVIPLWAFMVMIRLYRKSGKVGATLIRAGLFTVAAAILVLPWFVRNYLKHGEFTIGISGRVTFDAYHLASTLARAKGITIEDARYEIAVAEEPEKCRRQIILNYPVLFLREQAYGAAKTIVGIEHGFWMQMLWGRLPESSDVLVNLLRGDLSGFFKSLGRLNANVSDRLNLILILVGAGYTLVMYGLVAVGVFRGIRQGGPLKWWMILMGLTAVYLVVVPGARGASRFRVAADPGLATFGGLGQLDGREAKNKGREGH